MAMTEASHGTVRSHGCGVLRVATGIGSGGTGNVMLCHPGRIPSADKLGIYTAREA